MAEFDSLADQQSIATHAEGLLVKKLAAAEKDGWFSCELAAAGFGLHRHCICEPKCPRTC